MGQVHTGSYDCYYRTRTGWSERSDPLQLLSSRDAGLLEPPEQPQLTRLLFRLERGPGIALQAMQEKKALSSRRAAELQLCAQAR